MDFVKREDQRAVDEAGYKAYMENLQKTHQMDVPEYQHTLSMEQIHQAMQSSINTTLAHNFQMPLSPRQISSLMLKTNHIPAHMSRNLSSEIDLHNLPELSQHLKHEDLLLNRNLEMTLARTLNNELELQATQNLMQNITEQSLSTELPNDMEMDLSQHFRNDEMDRRINQVQDTQLLDPNFVQRLEQNMVQNIAQRLDPSLMQRLEQNIAQRLEQNMAHRFEQNIAQRLDQRVVNPVLIQEGTRQNEQYLCHIKSEQEDDGYIYDNVNQVVNVNGLIGHLPVQTDHHQQPVPTSTQENQMYAIYNNHLPNMATINGLELYSRQNYPQNFAPTNIRDNPQNLVVHRQFENHSPYSEEEMKKMRQNENDKSDGAKTEQPKENLKPTDQNKLVFQEYEIYTDKNESSTQNKISNDDLAINIKGEYACYKCNEVFPSKRGLKQHSRVCYNDSNDTEKLGKFSCSLCAYKCQSPAILKIHERTHTGEKPFACKFCDYRSGQKNNVAKHILVHMKEKPFHCQYCNYRCAQKNNLVVHERTHTGDKPFACPYCDYRTVQKPNLVKHMYLHTDQKPFSCDICNYRCVQKTNLTKHKQRHLHEKDGEKFDVKNQIKPYKPRQKSVKCPLCLYRCVQKSSLEKHIQFKHPGLHSVFQDANLEDQFLGNGVVQNLSVKKDDVDLNQQKVEPLQIQS